MVRGSNALNAFKKRFHEHFKEEQFPLIEVVEWRGTSGYPQLPKGKKAVYSFHLRSSPMVLKVGRAGGNTPARYSHQHYRVDPQSSTLANDIMRSPSLTGAPIKAENVGQWIREHTVRIDFLMPIDVHIDIVKYLEHFLFVEWHPKFEGTRE